MRLNVLSCFTIVIVSASFIQSSVCCRTGRIFIGSINETYPDQIDRNGIYIREESVIDGHHVYKHESRDYYLYHVSGNLIRSMWVVGSTPGGLTATLRLRTAVPSAELAPESWQIWIAGSHEWADERHMKAACVDDSFMTCTTGRLRLHGLSPWNHHQLNRTGLYYLTNETHEMRPIYQDEFQNNYLYYVDGLWMVGPEVGRVVAGLFVLDYAWRPEYIVESWIVFNGRQFLRDSKLKATCAGGQDTIPLSAPHGGAGDTGGAVDVGDILEIAEGVLQEGEGHSILPLCGASHCHNGGTCIRNEVDDFMCACPELYFGARCERSVVCGSPPDVANGRVVSQTGNGFHALAFYACLENFHLEGPSAVTCMEHGAWSEPPVCLDWLDYLSPPVARTSSRRRNAMTRALGRRRKHHRRVRSLPSAEHISIDEMKAMF